MTTRTATHKILLVDDDPAILELLRSTFQADARFDVILARTGDEAIAMFKRGHAEAVVLDIRLPGRNGFNVCRLIKGSPGGQGIPVILVSAMRPQEAWESWRKVGADVFVSKPFSPVELIALVEKGLGLTDAA
jgi:DNA-binding response OmpR family regulator